MSDLISRQDAIEALEHDRDTMPYEYSASDAIITIKALPSAQPEQKTGKWIIGKYRLTCDQCRFTYPNKLMDEMGVVNYCPNCGHPMKVGDAE